MGGAKIMAVDLEDPSGKSIEKDRSFLAGAFRLARLRVTLYVIAGLSVVTFIFFGSPFFLFFGVEQGFYPQWAAMRAHLSDVNDPATMRIRRNLLFYDLTMEYVLSYEGLMYILYWNMWRRYCFGPLCPDSTVFSATETNHGLSMWYIQPIPQTDDAKFCGHTQKSSAGGQERISRECGAETDHAPRPADRNREGWFVGLEFPVWNYGQE